VNEFWIIATLLCALAVAILVVPLWARQRVTGHWSGLGLAAAVAVVPIAFALYLHVSNWNPQEQQRAHEGERLVRQLAERLKSSPDDVQGWLLLARSYMQLGQYAEASAAYREAWTRTPEPDNDLKVGYAEAQLLSNRAALGGDAGRLLEDVLASDPNNLKALWYGGLIALENGREDLAKTRWSQLLQLEIPPDTATMVRARLAALGEAPPAAGARAAAAPSGPSVQLDVSLGAGRSVDQLPPSTALFIFARAPGGGPPLAVIRQPANAVPGQFTLSDANSMIPGRSLADYDELTLVARLSKSGQPTEQPGDWYAQTKFRPKDGGTVALVIDQVVQGEAPPAAAPRAAAAPSGPSVQLDVSLGAGRSVDQLPPSTALFIFARAPGGGPPLAVIRQPATAVPGRFTLSDANSMIPGRSLADYDELTLVARLSKSGQPTEQPGDWYAQTKFRPKDGGTVALVIDQVVQ
jgi:cytochrome c-type biogenesis protein CcmH